MDTMRSWVCESSHHERGDRVHLSLGRGHLLVGGVLEGDLIGEGQNDVRGRCNGSK